MKTDDTKTGAVVSASEQIDSRRAMIKELSTRIEGALHLDEVQNEDRALYDHAYALDLVFKRLLHSAEERLDKGRFAFTPALYALALKAQEQCRRTLVAAKAMREELEKTSTKRTK